MIGLLFAVALAVGVDTAPPPEPPAEACTAVEWVTPIDTEPAVDLCNIPGVPWWPLYQTSWVSSEGSTQRFPKLYEICRNEGGKVYTDVDHRGPVCLGTGRGFAVPCYRESVITVRYTSPDISWFYPQMPISGCNDTLITLLPRDACEATGECERIPFFDGELNFTIGVFE